MINGAKMDISKLYITKGAGTLYIQLYNRLKELIISGELKSGDKLPPIRELADSLGVNNVTVINAYKHLEKDGFIIKKVGSGSFVKSPKNNYRTDSYDFTGKDSNIENFPLEEITQSINYILENDGAEAFRYEDSQGYPKLQDSLKQYFSNFNIVVDREIIQIVSGGQQALDIISKALLDYGETVITEEPTYKGATNSFKSRDARVIQVPLKETGIDIKALESKVLSRKPSFIYLMPFNQKPTGINYSLSCKQSILDLANKHDFYIVEDDLGSEISLDRSETIKSLDLNDRVIYIKSFTPLFMPGLRLGAIIPPQKLHKKFLNIKRTTDISTPGLLQRGFTHYLNRKSWESYFLNVSKNLLQKIELTNKILGREFKGLIDYNKIHNSPSYWIKIKRGTGNDLYRICKELGVEIVEGESIGEDYSNYFRLNVKSIPLNRIENGLLLLKEGIIKLYSINSDKDIYL